MSDLCFLGIDTSNYTTSVAVCNTDGEVLVNRKALLPVKSGECGLRQSDAVFAHVKNLPVLIDALRTELRGKRIGAVAVSEKPRSVEGSYMPCFLSGVAVAEAFGAAWDVPLYRFSHQDGHIMAALVSSGAWNSVSGAPFAAFHVSGGTTEVLYVRPQFAGFDVEAVGGTEDLNAGQAIDRAGVMMGLSFPCGKEMEQLAAAFRGNLPPIRVCVRDCKCNLSGLQNLTQKLYAETHDPAAVSAYVFAFIGKSLQTMTEQLDLRFPEIPIVYAGGVMSNRMLQKQLSVRKNTYFAEPAFSADNAAGIALLCRERYLRGGSNDL